MPVSAACLVLVFAILICVIQVGSSVAFLALTATATIATNVGYLVPIVARQTVGRQHSKPGRWNLVSFSMPCAVVASLYISFICSAMLTAGLASLSQLLLVHLWSE